MKDLKALKKEWLVLCDEYHDDYGSHDGSIECELLLEKIRAIETTFRTLGTRVQDFDD